MIGWLIAITLALAYAAVAVVLHRRGVLERHNITLWGPVMMIRTQRGRRLLERLSTLRRFWTGYGYAGIAVLALTMVGMYVLLGFAAWFAIDTPKEAALSPIEMIVLPGVNPLIPFWYGIVALVFSVAVHEGSHGILSYVHRLKVNSLGALVMVIPIGAFVEPDEEAVRAASRRERSSLYAAGPMTNMAVAMVTLLILSGGMLAFVEPKREGLVALAFSSNSPLGDTDLRPGEQLIAVGDTPLNDWESLSDAEGLVPGTRVNLTVFDGHRTRTVSAVWGLVVLQVVEGSGAHCGGIVPDMILERVNGTLIKNYSTFRAAMDLTWYRQETEVAVLVRNGTKMPKGWAINASVADPTTVPNATLLPTGYLRIPLKVTLGSRDDPTLDGKGGPDRRTKGFLGVVVTPLGLSSAALASDLIWSLSHPFRWLGFPETFGFAGIAANLVSSITFLTLPFNSVLFPFHAPLTNLYEFGGPFAPLNGAPSAFWVAANTVYFIFWLNFLIGTFNALPAVPLDGGFVFRDAATYLMERFKLVADKERRDKIAGAVSIALSATVALMILWIMFGPYLLG